MQVWEQGDESLGHVCNGFWVGSGGAVYDQLACWFKVLRDVKAVTRCPCGGVGFREVGDFGGGDGHGLGDL